MKKGEYRQRAQRLLTDESKIDDLNCLFLFLRQNSHGNKTVRDIGDMIAHSDVRNKGLSLERISDLYEIAKFQALKIAEHPNWKFDLSDAPANLISAMEATFRLLSDEIIKRDTGYPRDQASKALAKLKRCFKTKANGRLTWTGSTPDDRQLALTSCLTSYIVSGPAYDGSKLFAEMVSLLRRHNLIDADQEMRLEAKRPNILLYAIAAMHGVRYRMHNGATVEAEAGWSSDTGDALLGVTASIATDYNEKSVSWAFPIFSTDLRASEWASDFTPDRPNVHWKVPIELTSEPRLRPLNWPTL